ncbi:somatostatin receptor type 4-like [Dreissena polymorpha]|uniref:G-protein coupled receptors family 1 profile domain-containing protein n=1 Tax=Dreissena polymorpha TaxID=45954 RepID=A0A9D4R6N7_DREPO|nr:somatostatin receptor type 4-like [Dreissena polymorpha]KAH3855842.1 hypothetical protein DPMN_098412 [Dreissena polymorpha]
MGENIVDQNTNRTVFTFLSEFHSTWNGQTVVEVCFLSAIFVVGMIGNVMILVAILRNTKLRTVTNILVCNLSMADILFALGIPCIATTRITRHWVLGEIVCKLITYVQFVSGISSILTMVMISVDRFISVCLLNKYKMTRRDLTLSLVATWVISAAFPIPVAISQTVKTVNSDDQAYKYCGVEWSINFRSDIYLTFMVTFFFFIPLIVIIILYSRIWLIVKCSNSRAMHGNGRSEQANKKQIRLVKMFASIVALFVVMWLPFFILSFLGVFYNQITSTHFTVTLILALANTCQNPLIYGYFNRRLRSEFKTMLCTKLFGRSQSSSSYNVQGTELGSAVRNSSNPNSSGQNSSTVA